MSGHEHSRKKQVPALKNKQNQLVENLPSLSRTSASTEEVPASVGYKFFAETGGARSIDAESRRTIRRHVMRNFFQQKNASTEDESSSLSSSTMKYKDSLKGRFRIQKSPKNASTGVKNQLDGHDALSTDGKRSESAGHDISASIQLHLKHYPHPAYSVPQDTILPLYNDHNSHRIDPFDTLPVRGSQRLETLLRYWRTVFQVNSVAINVVPGHWLGFAQEDAAILHSSLCSVAMYCSVYHGLDSSVDIPYHKVSAIALLKGRLSNTTEMISDAVIATIAALASFENLWGAYDTSASHLAGLRKLVALRGGLKSFMDNDPLHRAIIWAEYHLAAALRSHPPFKFEPPPCSAVFPDDFLTVAAVTSPNVIFNLPLHKHEIFNIHYHIHHLGLAFDAVWIDRMDRMLLSNMLHDVDFQLLHMPDYSDELVSKDAMDLSGAKSVVEALTVTAQMFLYGALRFIPLPVRIFDIFLSRLLAALRGRDLVVTWSTHCKLDVLLWVLTIGGIVAEGRRDSPWFIETLASMATAAGVQTMREYQIRLKSVAWTEEFCASSCAVLWRSASTMVAAPAGIDDSILHPDELSTYV